MALYEEIVAVGWNVFSRKLGKWITFKETISSSRLPRYESNKKPWPRCLLLRNLNKAKERLCVCFCTIDLSYFPLYMHSYLILCAQTVRVRLKCGDTPHLVRLCPMKHYLLHSRVHPRSLETIVAAKSAKYQHTNLPKFRKLINCHMVTQVRPLRFTHCVMFD